jgi:AcrR family transcriptional regulator
VNKSIVAIHVLFYTRTLFAMQELFANSLVVYAPCVAGRRDMLRTTLLQTIREAAVAELRRTSPSELSLREVARLAGISPSGLYRYFDGRDGLLELLIADGFERFGETVSTGLSAAGPHLRDQVMALAVAYRQWAKDNPEQFSLILGSPIAGFAASPNGPTEIAVRQFGMPMIAMMVRAYKAGELMVNTESEQVDLASFDPQLGAAPAHLIELSVRCWARIHGLVVLESFGHLGWSGQDIAELLASEVDCIVESFGTRVHQI